MEKEKKLNHLAIIMDGNRRWAKKNDLSRRQGHEAGVNKFVETISMCLTHDIKYFTVYAFSTENWKREEEEINNIMGLISKFLNMKEEFFIEKGINLKIIGVEDKIDPKLIEEVKSIQERTAKNDKIFVNIAFNYGGRREILDTTKKIATLVKNGEIDINQIDENLFKENLYYGNTPDPDLIIRTGGDFRISNFLLWEMAYSEFFFTDLFWPDFNEDYLIEVIDNFTKRERRFGGTIKNNY